MGKGVGMGCVAWQRAPSGVAQELEPAVAGARWVRQWRTWASWPLTVEIVVLAAFVVALDMVSAWTDVSLGSIGEIPVSPALPFALLMLALVGVDALGFSRVARHAWREYLFGAGGFLLLVAVMFAVRVGTFGEAAGVLTAAFGEELVYRFAAVIVVGAICARLMGREWRDPSRWGLAPGLVALGAAAMLFTVLPGHVQQMTGGTTLLPFASLSLLLGYVVLRTGALWPAVVTHALLNLITLVALARNQPSTLRLVFAAATLGSFILAADLAGRRMGQLNRVPSIIDLEAIEEEPIRVS
jgi:hypothetical protein